MNPKTRKLRQNLLLAAVFLLAAAFVLRNFSFTTKMDESYCGTLYSYSEESQTLQDLEGGTVRLTGSMTHHIRNGRRLSGELDITLEDSRSLSILSPVSDRCRGLDWYRAAALSGLPDPGPLEAGPFLCNEIYYAKDLSALGMSLEQDGERFFLIAAETEEEMDGARTAVLEIFQGLHEA